MRAKPTKPKGLKFDYPPDFERLWRAYPKTKSGAKWTAFSSWWQMDLTYAETVELVAHVDERVKRDAQWKRGYIPMLSSFLNQRRWDDEYERVDTRRSRHELANEEFREPWSDTETTLTPEQVRAQLKSTGLLH